MRTFTRAALAAALALAVTMTGAAGPALGAVPTSVADETPPATLADIKAAAIVAIESRDAALARTATAIEASSLVTDGHRSTVLATIAQQQGALAALASAIDADTTRAAAAAHYAQIFTDLRVFAVTIPQAHYASAADALEFGVIPSLQAAHDALAAAVVDHPEVSDELAQLQEQIDVAAGAVAGVADSALAVTPADYNANRAVLGDARASILTAKSAATTARGIAASILEVVR